MATEVDVKFRVPLLPFQTYVIIPVISMQMDPIIYPSAPVTILAIFITGFSKDLGGGHTNFYPQPNLPAASGTKAR